MIDSFKSKRIDFVREREFVGTRGVAANVVGQGRRVRDCQASGADDRPSDVIGHLGSSDDLASAWVDFYELAHTISNTKVRLIKWLSWNLSLVAKHTPIASYHDILNIVKAGSTGRDIRADTRLIEPAGKRVVCVETIVVSSLPRVAGNISCDIQPHILQRQRLDLRGRVIDLK